MSGTKRQFHSGDVRAYFISFRCYGTWLHGDPRGSVDRNFNTYHGPMRRHEERLKHFERKHLKQSITRLNYRARSIVQDAIENVCCHRQWELHALNVRVEHVHLVVTAPKCKPEKVMTSLKSWCTRRLRERGVMSREKKVWSRHGSTV